MGKFTSICHKHLNSLEHRIYLKTNEVSENLRKQLYCCRIMKCITAKHTLLQGIPLQYKQFWKFQIILHIFLKNVSTIHLYGLLQILYNYPYLITYINCSFIVIKKLYVIVCSREKSMWNMPKFFLYRRCWTSKYQRNGTGEWLGV